MNLRESYNRVAIIGFNTFLVFIFSSLLIRGFFAVNPQKRLEEKERLYRGYLQVSSLFNKNPEKLARIAQRDPEELSGLYLIEPLSSHPTLEFMEPPQRGKVYNVGFEGMRYTSSVTHENASQRINGSTWVFGGSTAFGHGLYDHETLASQLGELDPTQDYLNFGARAYNQNLEIQKLLLLLRKGYRPKRVVFLDGLNDILATYESNFHPVETPARLINAYGLSFNIDEFLAPEVRTIDLLARISGLASIQNHYTKSEPERALYRKAVRKGYDSIYEPDNLYTSDPIAHYKSRRLSSYEPGEFVDFEIYWNKLRRLYLYNNQFLQSLSKAFDFSYRVFIQPLGATSEKSAFVIQNLAPKTLIYKLHKYMQTKLSYEIAKGTFPQFVDLSAEEKGCDHCYIDHIHYSPELTRHLATRILEELRPGSQSRTIASSEEG